MVIVVWPPPLVKLNVVGDTLNMYPLACETLIVVPTLNVVSLILKLPLRAIPPAFELMLNVICVVPVPAVDDNEYHEPDLS